MLRSATASTSHPKGSTSRGPCSPISGTWLRSFVSNELRYEITPIPTRYGQSQTALAQSRLGRDSVAPVAAEMARRPGGAGRWGEGERGEADQDRREQLPHHCPAREEQHLVRHDEPDRR